MSGAGERVPGHWPADPQGYTLAAVPGGYAWTRRADGVTSEPHPTRAAAVAAARADRDGGGQDG